MSLGKFSPKVTAGVIVGLCLAVALYLRIALPYDQVFAGEWTKFTSVDGYWFMHQVDNLARNFPHLSSFDPYRHYPHGASVGSLNFFVYLLGGITWLVSLGSPTQHTIDMVGAYLPAILGAATVVTAYFIGKALFNRWAGAISAGLAAILPGEFLGRTTLGRVDRDALEVLLTASTMLFLILAVKSARRRELTFDHLKRRDWAVMTKPLLYSLLAGVFFGVYLLTWKGAFVFVFVVFAYVIVQSIVDHLRGTRTDYLCLIVTVTFLIALAMFLPTSPAKALLIPLVVAVLAPPLLSGLSWLMLRRKIRPAHYPLTLVGLGLAGVAVFYVVNPSLLTSIAQAVTRTFAPSAVGLTVGEIQPILFPGGEFSLSAVWANFTTSFFLSLISLGILLYLIIKRGEADKTLFVIWSLTVLAATLALRRFALLFALNAALLTGYFCWLVLQFASAKRAAAELVEPISKKQKKVRQEQRKRKQASSLTAKRTSTALVVIVLFLVLYPNIGPMPQVGPIPAGSSIAIYTAKHPYGPSDGWCESLSWIKENTPEPFATADFYYEPHQARFEYPETAYGIVAWWDYGYWIIRMAHRPTNCDPGSSTGSRTRVARFLTAQDEESANERIGKLGSNYVVIDHETVTNKFYDAIPKYAGPGGQAFSDTYYDVQDGEVVPVRLFYPEYYRSLASRLYNFDGKSVTPDSSIVISYAEKVGPDGEPYKEITNARSFPSYEEARAYVSSKQSGKYRIVGDCPFISPVPLEALEDYKLVYKSGTLHSDPRVGAIPQVKVFEFTR